MGKRTTLGLLLVGLLAASARAGTPIGETVAPAEKGRVTIENLSGSVHVTGWDQNEIRIEGELGDGADEVEVDRDDEEVSIEVIYPHRVRDVADTHLEIRLPHATHLEVETVSAEITVENVHGELELESVSGGVTVHGSGGSLQVETVSGGIDVTGDFSQLEVESVSGEVTVDGARGDIEAATTSGGILVHGETFENVQCTTVSGSIEFVGDPTDDAQLEFENFSGSTLLKLPADLNAYLDVETFSGTIHNAFGGRLQHEQYGPGASLSMTIGDREAEAEISVSSFSGRVEVQKK